MSTNKHLCLFSRHVEAFVHLATDPEFMMRHSDNMIHKKNDFNSFIPAKITILRKFRSSCSQVNSKGYPAVQSPEKNR